MTEYKVCEDTDSQHYVYGIAAFSDDVALRIIPRVFSSLKDARRVVGLLNELKIELCHLDDIVEDYLTDFEI